MEDKKDDISKELRREGDTSNYISAQLSRMESFDSKGSPNKDLHRGNIDRIHQTKHNLDDLIEDLNGRLFSHFHKKEEELLQQYKRELIAAQKQLNDLKNTTNQQQIKNKMVERKKELQKERHDLIKTNMLYSSKCEEYKKKLSDLVSEGKELEQEIVFLDGQMDLAQKRKYDMLSEVENQKFEQQRHFQTDRDDRNSKLPLFTEKKKIEIQHSTNRSVRDKPVYSTYEKGQLLSNSISMRTNLKKSLIQSMNVAPERKNLVRQFNWDQNDYELSKNNTAALGMRSKAKAKKLEDAVNIQKTPLQLLFQQTVEEVKERRKSKKVVGVSKGEEFTDFQKRLIMQQFLSKQQVKKKIYEIIFESSQDVKMYGALGAREEGRKVKITYDDIM